MPEKDKALDGRRLDFVARKKVEVEEDAAVKLKVDPPVHHLIHLVSAERSPRHAEHVVVRIGIRPTHYAGAVMVKAHEVLTQHRLKHFAQLDHTGMGDASGLVRLKRFHDGKPLRKE
jgi:hypothetical protein